MGTAQLILLIGGMTILGFMSIMIYSSFNDKTDFELYNEAYITASALGQSMFDRILTKGFDQKSIGKSFTTPDSLTAVGSIGPDTGESSVNLFNDVDDYKNYVKLDTMGILGVFRTRVDVRYVQKFNPDNNSSVRTFTKRIDVFVTNMYVRGDTLKFKYAVTY
jgi:hypothetical protein